MISVIIPIYNTAKYIKHCIDTVLESTYQDFEVILINDGSTDNSEQICTRYSNSDKRIKYFYQDNAGVSAARNLGIDNSKGEWIIFVDSDDYITNYFLELIDKEKNRDYDFLLFDCHWHERRNEPLNTDIAFDKNSSISFVKKALLSKSLFEDRNVSARSPVAKAYKRNFLVENNLRFPLGITIGEDELFNIQAYLEMKKCLYIPKTVYKVEFRIGSATHSYHNNYMDISKIFYEKLKQILISQSAFNNIEMTYYSSVLSGIVAILRNFIYHKQNNVSWKYRRKLCSNLNKEKIYQTALNYNIKLGSFKRKLLIFLFKMKCYDVIGLYFMYIDRN